MKERLPLTDVQQLIDWFQALPDWGWHAWDAVPQVRVPGQTVLPSSWTFSVATSGPERDSAIPAR